MKAKSLQFGKAMSAALFVLLLSVAGMKKALAQTQVATLQHGDDISVFYGATAFTQAHTAAVDGDIVTLSSGSFTTPTITKAITLRGAGVVSDSLAGTAPTIFSGAVVFSVPNDSIAVNVEGILFSNTVRPYKLINPVFTRCSFESVTNGNYNGSMINAQFINCMIRNFDFKYASNTTFINSVVWHPTALFGSGETSFFRTVLLYNSIFGPAQSVSGNIGGVSAFNSVIITQGSSTSASTYGANNSFINCLGIKSGSNTVFGSAYTSGCTTYSSYQEVFESFTGTFSLEEPFILKDEIATSFHGSDGTQVGIHGGFMPYSNRPSYMVLKRCNVANKSTIDGKLSVEIEVVTEE